MTDECGLCRAGAGPCTCQVPCGAPDCPCTASACPGPTRDGHRCDVPGLPVWCRPCQDRIVDAVQGLTEACVHLSPGRVEAPDGDTDRTRRATVDGSPSPSPAWDLVDEVIRWATAAEDRLRAHLGHASRTTQRHRVLTDAVGYLTANATPWLCSPGAVDDGRTALVLHRRAVVAAGIDDLEHRMDGVVCPVCDRKALARKDGSDYVECRACRNRWHEKEYGHLTRVYAAELEASGS